MQRLWLPYEGLYQYRYTGPDGVEHVFFASDTQSTCTHLKTAREMGLPSLGFWHYGAVTPETWRAPSGSGRGRASEGHQPVGYSGLNGWAALAASGD